MKKKFISTLLSATMLASAFGGLMPTAFAQAKAPQYQAKERQMEELGRGLIAVKTTADSAGQAKNGVYLSWRLLGTESLENQAFDIYRDGVKIYTTGPHDATCYVDTDGTATSQYKVVKKGSSSLLVAATKSVTPNAVNLTARGSYVGNNSEKNSFSYVDIPLERPADEKAYNGDMSYYYDLDSSHKGGANDASVGDLDGDGEYEIVLKWDPTNSKDASSSGYSGRVYIDAYEIDPNLTAGDNGHLYTWRIDLGQNIRAGAHDTQFLVYDFDGDGKSEMAVQTALGSKDALGNFVTKVGDTEEIRNYTDEENNTVYERKGHNIGPDFYTVFDGETGEALCTTAGIPLGREDGGDWGDSKMQRSHRFLAAVAYIDGVHPSIVMCRGYYNRAVVRAYTWDGSEMTLQWEHVGAEKAADSLYGQGNHNLSVADADNDGRDEIIYGSAVLDDNGKAIGNTYLGHGDAMHVNDFNNDGIQEVFSVKEKSEGYKTNAADFRVAGTGQNIFGVGASGDTGRGVMANVDDAYALANPNALALGWTSSHANVFDLTGAELKARPATSSRGMTNFLVYWDGDLGRELLDDNQLAKYYADTGYTVRFYNDGDGYMPISTNNYTKYNPSLVADIWGDWREEIISPIGKGQTDTPYLRILTSTLPTEYRLTTLMHDSQYRMAIAWQNVAYNQPPHTSYYIGSAALATDDAGNTLNYLAPATLFTNVTYEAPETVAVTGVSLTDEVVTVEKGKTIKINANVEPAEATKKGVTWTTSDETVATVTNGTVKGISEGTATVTATTKDGGFTASCEVTVFANDVTGIKVSDEIIDLGVGYSKQIAATVYPDNASDSSVVWSSSDNSVATVAQDGTVTGVGYGIAEITAKTTDGDFTDMCYVQVKPIDTMDKTGDDVFAFVGENTDTAITLDNNTAKSATLTVADATSAGATIEKSFEVYDENKATLTFRLVTGGQKGVTGDGEWNWTGHEYTMGIKLLDDEGNNIINIYQPYKEKAKDLTSVIADGEAKAVTASGSGWTNSGNVAGNIQGSAKRWKVTAEFDYNNDTCTFKIVGTGSDWVTDDGLMEQTFSLNGANFKTLQLYTVKDGEGTVKATPQMSEVNYSVSTTATGNAETVYNKSEVTETDIADWTQTGETLVYDSESGAIMFNPTKPGAEYNATKTFEIADDGLVMYDVDWHFGLSTGRESVYEYLQFGNAIRLGWNSTYGVYTSVDEGVTYDTTAIFTGANENYTKNVKVVYDATTRTVKSLTFDGNEVAAFTDYVLPEGATLDSVSFGLQRGGATSDWNYPNGISGLKVSQFVYGDDPILVSYADITSVESANVNVKFAVAGMTDDEVPLTLIAAAYDENGTLAEVQAKETSAPARGTEYTDTITFANDLTGKTVKLFMWDSVNGMQPLCD